MCLAEYMSSGIILVVSVLLNVSASLSFIVICFCVLWCCANISAVLSVSCSICLYIVSCVRSTFLALQKSRPCVVSVNVFNSTISLVFCCDVCVNCSSSSLCCSWACCCFVSVSLIKSSCSCCCVCYVFSSVSVSVSVCNVVCSAVSFVMSFCCCIWVVFSLYCCAFKVFEYVSFMFWWNRFCMCVFSIWQFLYVLEWDNWQLTHFLYVFVHFSGGHFPAHLTHL